MYAIEFQTKLRDGIIEIPQAKHTELISYLKDDNVHVIVLASQEKSPVSKVESVNWQDTHESFIEYLIENPILGVVHERISRDEIHER